MELVWVVFTGFVALAGLWFAYHFIVWAIFDDSFFDGGFEYPEEEDDSRDH